MIPAVMNAIYAIGYIEAWKFQNFNVVWIIAYLVQYMKYFIYHFTFIPHVFIRIHRWPAPNVSGFIAQLVRASNRYCEVAGSNPAEVLTFSGSCIRNCKNWILNCEDLSLLDFTSAVQYMKYFIYYFTFIPHGLIRTHRSPAPNVSGFIAQHHQVDRDL